VKISKSQLEQIIREEIVDVLEAHHMPGAGSSYRGAAYKRDDDEEDLEEVYSDQQRDWACAQKSDDFEGERKLTKKQAAEMCSGPMKKATS